MDDNEFLLYDRIEKIKSVVNKYGIDNWYISFSGGKDSSVLSALVDMAIPNNIPRVYSNTGIELNMVSDFVKSLQTNDSRYIIINPKIPIKTMLENEGYPFKSKEHSKILELYQKYGIENHTVQRYLNIREGYGKRYSCPKSLEYQFKENFKLKISDRCCVNLKENPLDEWAKENNKPCRMLGIMPSEGGRRATTKCLAFKQGGIVSFHPLSVVDKEWEDWFIETYNIPICKIYYPPYNFERTGCKGCPFNIYIKDELETLKKYFPIERKQCEELWRPIYNEYRKHKYRL